MKRIHLLGYLCDDNQSLKTHLGSVVMLCLLCLALDHWGDFFDDMLQILCVQASAKKMDGLPDFRGFLGFCPKVLEVIRGPA